MLHVGTEDAALPMLVRRCASRGVSNINTPIFNITLYVELCLALSLK